MSGSIDKFKMATLSNCDHLVDFHVWPAGGHINYHAWIDNFRSEDREIALILLSSFMFFSDKITDQLFVTAFTRLSNEFSMLANNFPEAMRAWRDFYDSVIVTYVQGETPSVTDSGITYARKARKKLGLPEQSVMFPDEALDAAIKTHRSVLFVDDFVGTGNQFVETWRRRREISPGRWSSFELYASGSQAAKFYYCNAMATQFGRSRITRECPQVRVSSGNIIPDRYSLVRPNSLLWPSDFSVAGPEFIRRVSLDLGIPDLGGEVGDWRGFCNLGLSIAFVDGAPDATIPLFSFERSGWTPLVRKAS